MSPTASKDTDEIKITKSEKRKKSDSSKSEQPKEKQVKKEKEESRVDIYAEIHKIEDEESSQRSGENDLKLWRETCGELRGLMKDVFELKLKNGQQAEITEKKIQASLLFVTLKKLNRIEKLRLKKSRDGTNTAKQSMDSFNLSLQNLLYEVMHLKKEVTKCVNFKSADDNLELIPTEQFYSEAPPTVSNPDTTRSDPHAQRLARLEWELAQRRRLNQEVEEREGERDRSDLIIRSKEDKLRELGPQLKGILERTVPVEKYLALPLTYRRDQLALARLLPSPLYVMYCQCQAYSEACDSELVVEVTGDQEEAKRFQEERTEDREGDMGEGKDDSQDPDLEEKTRRRVRRPGDEKDGLARSHPLSVVLKLRSLVLTCGWSPTLGVVTLQVALSEDLSTVTGELMMAESLLAHLTPGDDGLQSPNPATAWTLANMGVKDGIGKLLPGKLLYLWVQRLAGLDFPETTKPGSQTEAKSEVSKLYMENIINSIKSRLEYRLDLQKQLDKLALLKLDSSEVAARASLPVRTVAKLKSWQSVEWETFSQQDFTSHVSSSECVTPDCYFYRATITRDKAVMTAMVSISPSYPTVPPVFCLSLKVGDTVDTQETSEVIRDLEREINVEVGDERKEGLLSTMVHQLVLLTDIVLEVNTSLTGGTDGGFCKSQVFLDNVRGRMRRLPLYYNPLQQMFQQR